MSALVGLGMESPDVPKTDSMRKLLGERLNSRVMQMKDKINSEVIQPIEIIEHTAEERYTKSKYAYTSFIDKESKARYHN